MSHSEKPFISNFHHDPSSEFTVGNRSVDERDSLEPTETTMEFCPDGWDERVEAYFRSCMIYEKDEEALLEHVFSCKYCAEHISFLEELNESLGKYDFLRSINPRKQQ